MRCILCFLAIFSTASHAQEAPLEALDVRPSGEAYADAIRFRGIDTNVVYFDPTRPAPPLETRETPEPASEPDTSDQISLGETPRIVVILITAAILFFIAYTFVVHGGRLPVSFARTPEDGARDDGAPHEIAPEDHAAPVALNAILNMPDKRAALVALCKSLLAQTVAAQGVLFQRSWTDRDALRRVPQGFEHRAALRALVLASERVQFGGRDVSEEEFRNYVERVRPLWSGRPA